MLDTAGTQCKMHTDKLQPQGQAHEQIVEYLATSHISLIWEYRKPTKRYKKANDCGTSRNPQEAFKECVSMLFYIFCVCM